MPYKTRKRNGKKGESEFALAVKLCWFIYQFENPNNPIPLKKFCDEFEEIVEHGHILQILTDDYNVDWTFYNKDGSMCSPKYDTARKAWQPKYLWKEEYPQFKSDRLMSTDDSEMEKYIRQKSYFNRKDSEIMRTCYDKENDYLKKEAEEDSKDMTYYRNKNQETITNIEERWRRRLGLDKEQEKPVERKTVPDNPEHENNEIDQAWNDHLWKLVQPRT